MPRWRLSIAALGGLILLIAVGLGALRAATGYWAATLVTATVAVLVAAVLGSCRGRHRTAWLGFAVAGWAYAAMTLGPWDGIRPFLLSSSAIAEGYAALHATARPLPEWRTYRDEGWPANPPTQGRPGRSPLPKRIETVPGLGPSRIMMSDQGFEWVMIERPSFIAFERTAHCLFALMAGGLGSLLAVWFEGRSRREETGWEGGR